MAGTVLWTGEGLGLAIGTQILLDDAKISIHAGERVALVGRNGSGKSSFMRIVAGAEHHPSARLPAPAVSASPAWSRTARASTT